MLLLTLDRWTRRAKDYLVMWEKIVLQLNECIRINRTICELCHSLCWYLLFDFELIYRVGQLSKNIYLRSYELFQAPLFCYLSVNSNKPCHPQSIDTIGCIMVDAILLDKYLNPKMNYSHNIKCAFNHWFQILVKYL